MSGLSYSSTSTATCRPVASCAARITAVNLSSGSLSLCGRLYFFSHSSSWAESILFSDEGSSYFLLFRSRWSTGYTVHGSFVFCSSSVSSARPENNSFLPRKYASSVERKRLLPNRRGRDKNMGFPFCTRFHAYCVLSTYTQPSLRSFSKL